MRRMEPPSSSSTRRCAPEFYNFGGLDAFKSKFNPQGWERIFAIAEGETFSPTALYAIAGAFSGGAPIRLVMLALLRAAREELVSLFRKSTRGKRLGMKKPTLERHP